MKRAGERSPTEHEGGAVDPRWAERRRPSPARPTSYQYLLDLDVDLAEALDVRMRLAARPATTTVTFDAEPGDVELSERLAASAPGPGVLVLEGVLSVNVKVGDRIASELLGAGDIVDACQHEADDLLSCATEWRGLVPMRFAMLDGAFAQRVHPWPQIMQALLRRVERRARNLNVQRAIASQPRLEVRLALLLWHLAARWGRVEPGGIRLTLPLTHQLLGRLIGAERPSVSHALARLARAGVVTGHGDEWHLHGRVEDQLGAMLEPAGARVRPLMGAISARGQT
jgi:CRP/FNR family cyclic AMP-dependent transcriptional regulator